MQDFETDSYWAIMSGKALAGRFKGTKLDELPVSEKMKWKDWVKKHPDTVVLSVNGREDGPDVYNDYFSSSRGFRNSKAKDKRLKTKEPIYAFRYKGKSYAIAHQKTVGGFTAKVGDMNVFFYRRKGAELFESTTIYTSKASGFHQENDHWVHDASGCTFSPDSGLFEGDEKPCPQRLQGGFDTFWYNWSLNNPDTAVLK